jgi:chloramphenicol 3-O-phosphotransferase
MFLCFVVLLFFVAELYGCDTICPNQRGQLIILDGPSSVGKSTLAHTLQKSFEPERWHYHHKSLHADTLVAMVKKVELVSSDLCYNGLPELFKAVITNINSTTAESQEKKDKQERWNLIRAEWEELFYSKIAECLRRGELIIADVSLHQRRELKIALKRLAECNPFFVFVHLPFGKIIEWVEKRNSNLDTKEHRHTNQVLYQYALSYRTGCVDENNFIDIVSREMILQVTTAHYQKVFPFVPSGEELGKKIMATLGCSSQPVQTLIPRLQHDCVVDTAINAPQQAAEYVQYKLQTHLGSSLFFTNSLKKLEY